MSSATTYKLPSFPVEHLAEDGARFVIRPMLPADKAALQLFFKTIAKGDRDYLKDDVISAAVIDEWTDHMDYGRAIPLLGLEGDRVIAEGVLHRQRAPARRHVGSVRIVVDPTYRDKGVGRALLRKLAQVAKHEEIERLTFEIVADVEESARHAALMAGFVPLAVFSGHVKDADGTAHDLVCLEMRVQEQFPLPTDLY